MDDVIKKGSLRPSSTQNLTRHHQYSRKEKSLGLLCANFLTLYNRDGVESVELGDAERRLGVVRRRIYDVVNVLESVGFLLKKGKNEYYCKGFDGMQTKLNQLKVEALSGTSFTCFGARSGTSVASVELHQASDDNGDSQSFDSSYASGQHNSSNGSPHHNSISSFKQENKREKTLVNLAENFLKLFLGSENKLFSVDEAAQTLLGDGGNPPQISDNSKAKVRRLYDITNVLLSINLIEKTQHVASRKPAFRWLGLNGTPENGSLLSKKRAFGTEITNTLKKNRADTLFDEAKNKKVETQMQIKCEDLANETNHNKLHQPEQSKHGSQGVVFGPFSPDGLLKDNDIDTAKKTVECFQDWERLASSYRPQYQNKALADIFAHYMETWKSWYVEVTGKDPVQLL